MINNIFEKIGFNSLFLLLSGMSLLNTFERRSIRRQEKVLILQTPVCVRVQFESLFSTQHNRRERFEEMQVSGREIQSLLSLSSFLSLLGAHLHTFKGPFLCLL